MNGKLYKRITILVLTAAVALFAAAVIGAGFGSKAVAAASRPEVQPRICPFSNSVPGSGQDGVDSPDAPPAVSQDPSVTAAPDSGSDADRSGDNGETDGSDSSGGYFITKKHIIISCVVSLGIAILITFLQYRKRFK